MKKLLYTLLAVTIIFSACEKEEESSSNNNSNNNNISNNIIGEWDIHKQGVWTLTTITNENGNIDTVEFIPYTEYIEGYDDGPTPLLNVEFYNDDTYIITTLDDNNNLVNYNGVWELDNDILYMSDEIGDELNWFNYNSGYSITFIDNNEFTLYTEGYDKPLCGINSPYSGTTTFFKRIN